MLFRFKIHNHNNNQTNPKKQPNTINKPTSKPLKIKFTKKPTQQPNKNTEERSASPKQIAPFSINKIVTLQLSNKVYQIFPMIKLY
jgi:hypothetical protein